MTPVFCMAGAKLALFGLGGSGVATASALLAGGADVLAWDDNPASAAKAHAAGIPTGDLREEDWSRFAALVLAPGVPLTHPAPHWTVDLARGAGVEVIGDIELFCRERASLAPDAPFVAVTGTNGKSTTTALVAHILREAGRDVQMGGNIGTAILSLDPPDPDRVHVVELSSFQIDLTPSLSAVPRGEERGDGPTVGVLLNVTPDHLDRHGTMENYAAIKERLVGGAGVAIVGVDDPVTEAIARRLSAAGGSPGRAISAERVVDDGVFADGTTMVAVAGGERRTVADIAGIASLRGRHNAQNAAAAVAVCLALHVSPEEIAAGLSTFPGLPHRLEQVGRAGPVLFVNDSKATNADSTEKALLAFDDVFWIAGGKAKDGGIDALQPLFTKIRHAFLIGEATEAFAASLGDAVPFTRCGTLDRAVAAAAAMAARSDAAEPVVLLSPACASYDQFPNFEVRGDRFRDLVRALPGIQMRT